MAGPSNSVANAAPIPTSFFPHAVKVQTQAVGNTGTAGSHSVDYGVSAPSQPAPPPTPAARFVWPWEHWAPLIGAVKERFGG